MGISNNTWEKSSVSEGDTSIGQRKKTQNHEFCVNL